jgi:hypothetical protein
MKTLLLCAGAFAAGAVISTVVITVGVVMSIADATSDGDSFYDTIENWWFDDIFDETQT